MAHAGPVHAARALRRALRHGEDHHVAARQRHHLHPRLLARTLLRQHEFPPVEIRPRLRQQHGRLQREHVLAVQVLVQAVVVAGTVLQQQRRGPLLAGRMAAGQEFRMVGREARIDLQQVVPAVGDGGQRPVQGLAQRRHRGRQRITEILVLAAAKAMLRHHDTAAEQLALPVLGRHGRALVGRQHARHDGVAVQVQFLADSLPVQPRHVGGDADGRPDGAPRGGTCRVGRLDGIGGSRRAGSLSRHRLARLARQRTAAEIEFTVIH